MKQFALALMLSAAAPAAWAAEQLSLNQVSAYLNDLSTAKAKFTQISDDGSLATGQLYLHRPGRARFEYDPPNGGTVIAGGGAVVIHDPKSNQPPETYPLRRTPLSVILDRHVDLGRANMVVGHGFDGTVTVVRAQDPKNPEYGSIEMMFTDNPVELRKWVIHDGAGGQTTVLLGDLATGVSLSSSLFTPGAGTRNR
ncbi:outer membrane lipoprotein carrier protein LolA [Rhodobacteraceae bacterium M382]|nr:outer membrane lipoprotein carrier protein LolA [Rhodobacteraceae bacterium M382]